MAEPKTRPTTASVPAFIAKVKDPLLRDDCTALVGIMTAVTKAPAVLWGTSIVGFGAYRYSYAAGRERDWPLVAFSPRAKNLVIYVMPGSGLRRPHAALGRYRGVSCIYVKRLRDLDLPTLKKLVRRRRASAEDLEALTAAARSLRVGPLTCWGRRSSPAATALRAALGLPEGHRSTSGRCRCGAGLRRGLRPRRMDRTGRSSLLALGAFGKTVFVVLLTAMAVRRGAGSPPGVRVDLAGGCSWTAARRDAVAEPERPGWRRPASLGAEPRFPRPTVQSADARDRPGRDGGGQRGRSARLPRAGRSPQPLRASGGLSA